MTKKEAGALGGKATLAKYGPDHMREIGKKGYRATKARYDRVPYGVTEWALVRKIDHTIIKTWR